MKNKVIYVFESVILKKYELSKLQGSITIGSKNSDTIIVESFKETYDVKVEDKVLIIDSNKTEIELLKDKAVNIEDVGFLLSDDCQFACSINDSKFLKFDEFGFIDFYKMELITRNDYYLNHKKQIGKTNIQYGDVLYISGLEIVFQKNQILCNQKIEADGIIFLGEEKQTFPDEYPDYRRSPRIIHRVPEYEIKILNPPEPIAPPNEKFLKVLIAPVAGAATTLIMALLRANPLFMLMGIITTAIGIINAVVKFFQDKKRYSIDSKDRVEKYQEYLVQKIGQLEEAQQQQKFTLNYHYPKTEELFNLCDNYSQRIYERGVYHHDFLHVKVGLGTIRASYPIQFDTNAERQNTDELFTMAKEINDKYRFLDNQPLTIDFMQGMIGYVGKRSVVVEQIQWLLMQVAFFHSYHDVEMISIFREEEYETWDSLKWLKHFKLSAFNMRGFVYHDRSRDQVLNSLNQILKTRKQALQERVSESRRFSPHYIIVVTDEKLIIDHAIMELLSEDPISLGVTLIHVKDVVENLSEYTKTVIDIRSDNQGVVVLENQEFRNKRFNLEKANFSIESFARKLSPLNHLLNMTNTIPESITFLELYQVEHVDELQADRRWKTNETYKTMAVPLGVRGKDDIVYLNLHEKAHGPHGLVAGTTGSGKSEIIQSYILSLAVHFHPHEVAFLLIDYKGGGMANLFKDLPHHLGSITNLDGSQSMRALISIKAELQRRQRLFAQYEVNHINQYQKLYKEGKTAIPMPHLFLISDEFAELKSEQPEFMKELISTARIGRSLGIHLILATQKPSGVVDGQIWSNSKFKLCLKVQDSADSNEMLKTTDAANITQPGRAYLLVGNNEVYELFQSAWSGADYIVEQEDRDLLDNTVYKINELGQYEIISDDLSGLSAEKEQGKVETELDAVISYLQDCADSLKIEKLPKPWLPPLEENLYLTNTNYKKEWEKEKGSFIVPFSMMDLPYSQQQEQYHLDFSKNGNFIVYGSAGYGKSTALQTIIMNGARKFSPANLHVYLFDFGTNGLLPLKGLPHVADIFNLDNKSKIVKWVNIIQREIKHRKDLLSQYSVANIEMYEKASKETLPIITIVVDNYDAVRESDFQEEMDTILTQISREGVSVGIHILMSATRGGSLRYQLSSNFKLQLCLYMIDKTEVTSIIGRSEFDIDELAGRGLMLLDIPTLMQVSLPACGEDSLEIVNNIQSEALEMDNYYAGERPKAVPMLQEKVVYNDFVRMPEVTVLLEQKNILPMGVEEESVLPLGYDYKYSPLLILSRSEDHLNKKMTFVINMLMEKKSSIYVFDNELMLLSKHESSVKSYIYSKETFENTIDRLYSLMQKRLIEFTEFVKDEGLERAREMFDKKRESEFVVLNNLSHIIGQLSTLHQAKLLELITNQNKSNIYVILGCINAYVTKGYDETSKYIKGLKNAIIDTKVSESAIAIGQTILREKIPADNMGYYIKNERVVRIQFVDEK